jgi:hypothetical protein
MRRRLAERKHEKKKPQQNCVGCPMPCSEQTPKRQLKQQISTTIDRDWKRE